MSGLVTIAFVIMETAWLAAVFSVLGRLIDLPGWPDLILLSPVYPLAWLTGRLAAGSSPALGGGRAGTLARAAAGLAALALVWWFLRPGDRPWPPPAGSLWPEIRAGLTIAVCGGFALHRGWTLAGRRVDRAGMLSGLRLGVVLLVVVLAAGRAAEMDQTRPTALTAVFMIAGLTGLMLARSAVAGQRRGRGALRTGLPGLFLLAALTAGLWLITDRDVVRLVLTPLVWLWDLVTTLLNWLLSLLSTDREPVVLPEPPPPPEIRLDETLSGRLFRWVRPIGQAVFLGSSILILLGVLKRNIEDLLAWLARRFDAPPGARIGRSRAGMWSDFKALLRLLARLPAALRNLLSGRSGSRTGRGRARTTAVRQIYRRLLRWAEARDAGRTPDQTPDEFLARLTPRLGDRVDAARRLTLLYTTARYGPVPLDRTAAAEARRCWRKIRRGGLTQPAAVPPPATEEAK